ncbi:MAG: ArsC/Spx/MgsR family protein [Parvularculaceae bacterium]
MKFYTLKTCDTCRKALKEIRAAGHDPVVIDVRADGVSTTDIKRWLKSVGIEKLLNKKSTTWRGLTDAEKAEADKSKSDGAGVVALLVTNPTLIKRPVIESDQGISVGWTEDVKAALL